MESDRAVHANGRTLPGYRIETMDCAAEESEIRLAVAGVDGLRALHFDLGQRTLRIDADAAALPTILALIRKAGFDPQALSGSAGTVAATDAGPSREKLRLVLAVLLAGCAEAVVLLVPAGGVARVLTLALAVSAIALSGFSTYRKGVSALLRGRLNINALMSVAVSGALLIGEWPEAAMVMALYAIAELIEARAVDRARNAIKGLLDLAPETAESKQADGSWMSVAAAQVPVDAVVRVRPGARIPLDGVVLAGNASVNQAPVTGESLPVDKAPGDDVFAGTINETGTLELRVTAASGNTLLARIIHAVEQAQGDACADAAASSTASRRSTRRRVRLRGAGCRADAVAGRLELDAGHLQGAGAAGHRLPLRAGDLDAGDHRQRPGRGCAPRHPGQGRRVSGKRASLKAIALDKTGTITEGKPRLVANGVPAVAETERPPDRTSSRVLAGHSDHPVSRAIADTQAEATVSERLQGAAGRGREAQRSMDRRTRARQPPPDRGARAVRRGLEARLASTNARAGR
jgi:Cd2+/Zn2+-exporting ATPase